MNDQTSSIKRSRAVALMLMAMAASAVMAQTSGTAATTTGVTNLSASKSTAATGADTSTATAASATAASATAASAAAKAAVTQTPAPSNASLTPVATNRGGDATTHLLKLQAEGQYASRNAYPVTSDVAQRTYQRYLESFTHKIPESSETQVGNNSGGSR